MITRLVAALALLALVAAPTVAASPASAEAERVPAQVPLRPVKDCDAEFVSFDTNRDGRLSYAEYAKGSYGQLRFGTVPSPEQIKRHLQGFEEGARKADKNHDGFLSPAEHRTKCQQAMG